MHNASPSLLPGERSPGSGRDGAGVGSGGTALGLRAGAAIAGEAGMVRELHRYLVRNAGVQPDRVASMGYWRLGKAEHA
ncbi:SIP domain-containing protein [Paenarthrobacter sp. PH39-S1]|uniref:SIP domain-containing protein n=1 Tax=Paenarthrobacter sp. PH39-S1 TaxID=3046204 RepID=UPI0032D9AAED